MSNFKERMNLLWEEAKDSDHTISQAEFARRVGATRSQLRGWLSGAGEPDTEMLKIIAAKNSVSIDWLTGFTDMRNYELKKGSPTYNAVLAEIKKEAGVSSAGAIGLGGSEKISPETLQKLLALAEQIKKEIAED